MNSVSLTLTYYFTFDLSKEFDLKAQTVPATNEDVQSSWISTMKLHFTFDVWFLVVQQIYTGFFVSFISRCFPFVIDTLHYDNIILNVCFIGGSVTMTLTSLVIGRVNLSSKGVYLSGILCLAAMFLGHLVLFLIQRRLGGQMNIILVCLLVFIYAFCIMQLAVDLLQLRVLYIRSNQFFGFSKFFGHELWSTSHTVSPFYCVFRNCFS